MNLFNPQWVSAILSKIQRFLGRPFDNGVKLFSEEATLRTFLAALFCAFLASSAFASGVAFPPKDCSGDMPFMAFTGSGDTYCVSAQDILDKALACTEGQQVVFSGGNFICQNAPNIPTCNNGEVLTYTGAGLTCVAKVDPASIPSCGTGQFLTYNGSVFQCSTVTMPTIPSCSTGQFLTATNGQLACIDNSGGGNTSCTQETWQLHTSYATWNQVFYKQVDGSYVGLSPQAGWPGGHLISSQQFASGQHSAGQYNYIAYMYSASPGMVGADALCIDGYWTTLTTYMPTDPVPFPD